MKSFLLLCVSVVFHFSVMAQKNIPLTDKISVEGKVKNPLTISLKELDIYKQYTLDSILITNHLKQPRSVLKNLKLVLLKDVLSGLIIDSPGPKELSAYYFIMEASDGYKVVFSWNELFNNVTGDSVYLIIAYNGVKGLDMPNRVALIAASDSATGRRYIKGLSKIIVSKIQ
ncbi:MAG: molybdopterin-binding protein [Niabella sp.]